MTLSEDLWRELGRRLHRGSRDAVDALDYGNQDGFIRLEPHCGSYSIEEDAQFWGGFCLGRGYLMANLYGDDELEQKLLRRSYHVEKLSGIPNVDTGFSGFFGLAIGFETTGELRLRDSALEAAKSVARLFHHDVGVFLTHPFGGADEDFMQLPFSDVFCERELLVDTGAILDLLWWASKYEKSYTDILETHYKRCLELDLVEPGGQAHHALNFDSAGKPLELHTHQGYQHGTRWTRAQAWGCLGYATAFLTTGMTEFKSAALNAIEKMLSDLDGRLVGPYDFDAPGPRVPEDTCSTMITIVAMERLRAANVSLPSHFTDYADAALALATRKYVTPGGTLLHGCWGGLQGDPGEGVLPYGNYFIAEAVFRKLRPEADLWGLPVASPA